MTHLLLDTDPLRIGTWNVEYALGAAKNRLRAERLRQANTDVWVLTEHHDRLDLGPGHRVVASPPSRRSGGRWVAIASRLPGRRGPADDRSRSHDVWSSSTGSSGRP